MENWPELELNKQQGENMCFGCSNINPFSLKLKFAWDPATKTAQAQFTPNENFQGWSGYLHGGITSCALDEAMGWAAMSAGHQNVTARLQVRFRRMVPIGQTYTVICKVTKQSSRLIETEACLKDKNGEILAEATSTQFVVRIHKDGQ